MSSGEIIHPPADIKLHGESDWADWHIILQDWCQDMDICDMVNPDTKPPRTLDEKPTEPEDMEDMALQMTTHIYRLNRNWLNGSLSAMH
jgi:hypothetical protein